MPSLKVLPLATLTKCSEAQAGHRTGTCVSAASEAVPGSQCCTFIPVRGHLKMTLRSMLEICARRGDLEIAGQYLRRCPERIDASSGEDIAQRL